MRGDMSVTEAAEALGTSPQTVRALLRKGELLGERRAWGSRYVWVVSQAGVDAFLADHGRLDGRRRSARPTSLDDLLSAPEAEPSGRDEAPARPTRARSRPFFLRPRGRASVVVVLLGVPFLSAYATAAILPGALWFDELGQVDVFRRLVAARADFHLRVVAAVALFLGANLVVACRGTRLLSRVSGMLGILAGSLVVGNLFASAATADFQTYLLWRHRQSFGEVDPQSGKDVGFFVFSLPFHLALSAWLLGLVVVTVVVVAATYRVRGAVGLRPRHLRFGAQVHLAALAALFLLVVAWRLDLERYVLELGQPSTRAAHSFAGVGYVDVNVRLPMLTGLSVGALVLAAGCLAAPFVARTHPTRPVRLVAGGVVAVTVIVGALAAVLTPLLVQRYVVDPNPLASEAPYLARSIAATRSGLGLDEIDTTLYAPEGRFDAADFADARSRLARVPTWDGYVLGARMRQLVAEPPYYSPEDPDLDVLKAGGHTSVTAVSARELDLDEVPDQGTSWVNNRLAFTHGLGLVRFSSTAIGPDREPRLLDSGLGVAQPRLYFGNLPALDSDPDRAKQELRLLTPTLDEHVATSQWVVANTRRPEVDVPTAGGATRSSYHYDGSGGIPMSSWTRRAVFALALDSKELLLSDEITPESRLLLHRDVHDRLHTLAPFLQWDSAAVPLTANGRILFVVDGYTTSDSYPNAEQVDLGGDRVTYARASVIATVDAFTGEVELYVTDESEPLIRAWREIFPTLFRSFSMLPDELRDRVRYPGDLFDAQASAYERFHTTEPNVFVSGADAWSRPIALSGPIEVAGNVDFDESDEDDLRLTMPPVYIYSPPPGDSQPRMVRVTYYSPVRGQNLVGSLSGWIDDQGHARLAGRGLPRSPVTLGPAQVSRLVFATPRVSNLLGLRNLEIRDLDKSSIDSVLLGRPRIIFLRGGLVQVQNLYEGSRGPGAARLLGVTAFVNGRAGLGPDVQSAVRQALNEPPTVRLLPPTKIVVGQRATIGFRVDKARREVVRITSTTGEVRTSLAIDSGRGRVTWMPTESGEARIRIDVAGLDGTRTSDTATVQVLGPAPRLRLIDRPRAAAVGRPVRVRFEVADGLSEVATVSTRSGIAFTRRYEIRDGRGVVTWTPDAAGPAELAIRVRGTEGQVTRRTLDIEVGPSNVVTPPSVMILRTPDPIPVGEESTFVFQVADCLSARAQITGPDDEVDRAWRFACPADPVRIAWTPTTPGPFRLTVVARGEASTSQASVPLTVEEPE